MKYLIFLLLFSPIALAQQYTYTKDIKPLFKKRCSMCHDGMPQYDWQHYSLAYKYRDLIKHKVFVTKSMPMGNATNMTDAERKEVAQWVDENAPR